MISALYIHIEMDIYKWIIEISPREGSVRLGVECCMKNGVGIIYNDDKTINVNLIIDIHG